MGNAASKRKNNDSHTPAHSASPPTLPMIPDNSVASQMASASYGTMPMAEITSSSRDNLREQRQQRFEEVPSQQIKVESNAGSLVLKGNSLAAIPSFVFAMTDLHVLDVSDNELKEVSPAIARLKSLKRLGIGGNQLTQIPDAIGELQDLVWLDFTHNRVSHVSERIVQLHNLMSLGASDCHLTSFPLSFCMLTNLRKLGVFNNTIAALPKEIGSLRLLTKLDLSGNALRRLPDEIGKLKQLTWLNLSSNAVEELPASLNNLVELRELGLSYNRLKRLPDLSGLQQLTLFPAYNNEIEFVGPWLGALPNLSKVDLSHNNLASLPPNIFHPPRLHFLNLRHNRLTELPPIDAANLSHTHGHLTHLDVRHNRLTVLPLALLSPVLKELRCAENPFVETLPPDVAGAYDVPTLLQLAMQPYLSNKTGEGGWDGVVMPALIELQFATERNRAQECQQCRAQYSCSPICMLDYRDASDRLVTPFRAYVCGPLCRRAFASAVTQRLTELEIRIKEAERQRRLERERLLERAHGQAMRQDEQEGNEHERMQPA